MKLMSKTLSTALMLAVVSTSAFSDDAQTELPSCIKSGSAFANKMNLEQRGELFVSGTITDCNDVVWDISLIPGANASKEMTMRAISRSANRVANNTTHLVDGDTYERMGENIQTVFNGSSRIAGLGLNNMKEAVVDDAIVGGIGETMIGRSARNWREGFSTAGEVAKDRNFGWTAGILYAGLLKPTGIFIKKVDN